MNFSWRTNTLIATIAIIALLPFEASAKCSQQQVSSCKAGLRQESGLVFNRDKALEGYRMCRQLCGDQTHTPPKRNKGSTGSPGSGGYRGGPVNR